MDVRLSRITLQFPGTRALSDVTVTFRTDEVHGLIGENGAGKSTLVSVLGGSLRPTAGTVEIGGAAIALASPRDALVRGIAHVSQEGSLVPALTGAENVLLGDEPRRAGGVIRRAALRERAAALVARWFPEVEIDLGRPVGALPMADQQDHRDRARAPRRRRARHSRRADRDAARPREGAALGASSAACPRRASASC